MIGKSRKQSRIRTQQHRSAEPGSWFSLEKIDAAYHWLCTHRRHYPADCDIWLVRFHWSHYRNDLYQALNTDSFELTPQLHIVKMDGNDLHCWSSVDALVLKLLAWHLDALLPTAKVCTHLKDHGCFVFIAARSIDDAKGHILSSLYGRHYHLLQNALAVTKSRRVTESAVVAIKINQGPCEDVYWLHCEGL